MIRLTIGEPPSLGRMSARPLPGPSVRGNTTGSYHATRGGSQAVGSIAVLSVPSQLGRCNSSPCLPVPGRRGRAGQREFANRFSKTGFDVDDYLAESPGMHSVIGRVNRISPCPAGGAMDRKDVVGGCGCGRWACVCHSPAHTGDGCRHCPRERRPAGLRARRRRRARDPARAGLGSRIAGVSGPVPAAANQVRADGGDDDSGSPDTRITLNGSQSSPREGVTYRWFQMGDRRSRGRPRTRASFRSTRRSRAFTGSG